MKKNDKVDKAHRFSLKYDGREEEYLESAKELLVGDNNSEYLEWIKKDNNSLLKSSNIYLLLKRDKHEN